MEYVMGNQGNLLRFDVHNPGLGHLHVTLTPTIRQLTAAATGGVDRRLRMLEGHGVTLDVDRHGKDAASASLSGRLYNTEADSLWNPYIKADWFPPKAGTQLALLVQLYMMLTDPQQDLTFHQLFNGLDINDPPPELLELLAPFLRPT